MADPLWEQGGWDSLPALAGELEAELCVVGLGGSGLSAVQRALALGVSVVGIDAGAVAGGAAGRNGGFLLAGTAAFYHVARQQLGAERARALYQATVDQIQQMAEETPELVRLTGSLRIAIDDAEYDDCLAQQAALREDRLPVERYCGDEGRGLLLPTDGAFNPLARARELARRALAGGAQLFERTPAVAIASGRVTTPGGAVRAKHIIVAVDGRLEQLLPQLKGQVRSARLQMLASAPTPEVRFPRPVYANYGYLYWQQLPSGEVALGGFRDTFREAEWTIEDTPSAAVQARLEQFLREQLGVQAPVTHRWAAVVGYTEGILPVFAELLPGVWAVGGYNGTGNVIGALCGKAAVEQALTGRSSLARLFSG